MAGCISKTAHPRTITHLSTYRYRRRVNFAYTTITAMPIMPNHNGTCPFFVSFLNFFLQSTVSRLSWSANSHFMAAVRSRCGHYIFALWFLSIYLFYSSRLILAAADWMSTILPHMVWPYSANLECRSEICRTRLVGNT